MTLREELGKVLENFGSLYDDNVAEYIVKHRVKEALTAIEKLIAERYTPKTDVMEYVSEIHNLKYTAQEAFEKAMTALFGDEWRKMFRAEIVSDADKSLRNAFGIPEGKE